MVVEANMISEKSTPKDIKEAVDKIQCRKSTRVNKKH